MVECVREEISRLATRLRLFKSQRTVTGERERESQVTIPGMRRVPDSACQTRWWTAFLVLALVCWWWWCLQELMDPRLLESKELAPNKLLFYSTMKDVGLAQEVAIRSWLSIGADVVLFLDSPKATSRAWEMKNTWGGRIYIEETPGPRSPDSGAPRLDKLMQRGTTLGNKYEYLCLINGDIVVPRTFGTPLFNVLDQHPQDFVVIGERLDCSSIVHHPERISSLEDLERYVPFPCIPHGSGGKDYFLYPKHMFADRNLEIPPFYMGKHVWDHWLVHTTSEFGLDITPSILVGHIGHEYPWMQAPNDDSSVTSQPHPDVTWNRQLVLAGCKHKSVSQCLPLQSTYNVRNQLCPDGGIGAMPTQARSLYQQSSLTFQQRVNKELLKRTRTQYPHNQYWDQATMVEWSESHGC